MWYLPQWGLTVKIWRQSRTLTIVCNRWGSVEPLWQNFKEGNPFLVLGFLFVNLQLVSSGGISVRVYDNSIFYSSCVCMDIFVKFSMVVEFPHDFFKNFLIPLFLTLPCPHSNSSSSFFYACNTMYFMQLVSAF